MPEPTFDVYIGSDGTPVVHVCTEDMDENNDGPIIRVYLNDELLFGNPDLQGDDDE